LASTTTLLRLDLDLSFYLFAPARPFATTSKKSRSQQSTVLVSADEDELLNFFDLCDELSKLSQVCTIQ
jgi:hypothetical protein